MQSKNVTSKLVSGKGAFSTLYYFNVYSHWHCMNGANKCKTVFGLWRRRYPTVAYALLMTFFVVSTPCAEAARMIHALVTCVKEVGLTLSMLQET